MIFRCNSRWSISPHPLLKVFELHEKSTINDLHRVYLKRIKLYHPDVNSNANAVKQLHKLRLDYEELRQWILKRQSSTKVPPFSNTSQFKSPNQNSTTSYREFKQYWDQEHNFTKHSGQAFIWADKEAWKIIVVWGFSLLIPLTCLALICTSRHDLRRQTHSLQLATEFVKQHNTNSNKKKEKKIVTKPQSMFVHSFRDQIRARASKLHVAAQHDDLQTLFREIQNQNPIQVLDRYDRNCLHYAAYCGHPNNVRLLLLFPFDVCQQDKFGQSALDYARQKGHEEICDLLESKL